MKKKVKKKWLKALETGEVAGNPVEQIRGQLRDDQTEGVLGLCCLGVLTELAVEDGVIEPGLLQSNGSYTYTDKSKEEGAGVWFGVLPLDVRRWAGLTDTESDPKMGRRRATVWNDTECKTFPEIAELVKEHL